MHPKLKADNRVKYDDMQSKLKSFEGRIDDIHRSIELLNMDSQVATGSERFDALEATLKDHCSTHMSKLGALEK